MKRQPRNNSKICTQLWDRIAKDPHDENIRPEWEVLWRKASAGVEDSPFPDLERLAYTGWILAIAVGRYQEALDLITPIVSDSRFAMLDMIIQFGARCDLGMLQFLCGLAESASGTYLEILTRMTQRVEHLLLRGSFLSCRAYSARAPGQLGSVADLVSAIVSHPKFSTLDADAQFSMRCNSALIQFLSGHVEPAGDTYEHLRLHATCGAEKRLVRESVMLCFAHSPPTVSVPEGLMRVTKRMYRKVARALRQRGSEVGITYGEVYGQIDT